MKRALVLLLALAACGPIDTVIGRETDGGTSQQGQPCANNPDCMTDEFCEKTSCSEAGGHCHHRQPTMDDDYKPVCGCNGVTYWNDSLRQADGTALAQTQACSVPTACSTADECSHGPGAACARLDVSDDVCPGTVSGVCWFMPPVCPAGAPTDWQPCAGGACIDLCGAIRSQAPALQKTSCP